MLDNFKDKWVRILFLSVIITVSGCGNEADVQLSEIKFLVLQECKEQAISYLSSMPKESGLSFDYVSFNYEVPSHSEVVGYINLKSKYEKAKDLDVYVNRLWLDCYPATTSKIAMNKEGYLEEALYAIESDQRLGVKKHYIKIEGGEVIIYFKDPLKN